MIQPMLAREALTIEEALSDVKSAWADEKLDGFRMILDTNGGRPLAYSRQGNMFVLPMYLNEALMQLPEGVYDGELICSTGTMLSHRHKLQKALAIDAKEDELDLHYAIFDLLECEGNDLKSNELLVRKELLDYAIGNDRTQPVFCLKGGYVTEDNLDAVVGLYRIREGLVFKDSRSKYVPGKRVGFWKKVLNPEYGRAIAA